MARIPYGRQSINEKDRMAVGEVLRSDWLTQGPVVAKFEKAVAEYHGVKYGVAFSNGTAALHGAYHVSAKFPFGAKGKTIEPLHSFCSWGKPSPADFGRFCEQYWEYITTPITFLASANGGLYCGGAPKLVDIDLSTYCIDISRIEEAITEDTRVITPVSYAGYPVDIKAMRDLHKVKENNICIIHDACHALGARRDGHGIADFAHMTILSFHPVKHITTGEGGMVLTNDESYYKALLLFRSHGLLKDPDAFMEESHGEWYHEMQDLGYNYRITDMQCALGLSQLERLNDFLIARNEIAARYRDKLKGIGGITCPPGFDNSMCHRGNISLIENLHSYHLFPVLLKDGNKREHVYKVMKKYGIDCQIHYIPIFLQPYYKAMGVRPNDYPKAMEFYARELSLPMFVGLTEEMQENVVGRLIAKGVL